MPSTIQYYIWIVLRSASLLRMVFPFLMVSHFLMILPPHHCNLKHCQISWNFKLFPRILPIRPLWTTLPDWICKSALMSASTHLLTIVLSYINPVRELFSPFYLVSVETPIWTSGLLFFLFRFLISPMMKQIENTPGMSSGWASSIWYPFNPN